MRDQWAIERDKVEWSRVEALKKLFVAIQRDLIETHYPVLAE